VLLAAADVTAALKEDDHKLQKRTAMSHVGGRVKIRTQVGLSVGGLVCQAEGGREGASPLCSFRKHARFLTALVERARWARRCHRLHL
jgi:hypothetical protein